ncbi:MAG: hypothetical protein HYV37_00245 [Candidatus Levyibacteriota bacterium]|nr:MAG: hypothetical protein HYV37_00245 [Candidatus Levybacteria bacterium]
MKKIFAFFSTIIALLASPPFAYAETIIDCTKTQQFKSLCDLSAGKLGQTISQLITFAFVLAIIIALAFLIWGGIKWITSGGDKTGVEEARNHVIAAVVGLIIVFLSYFILNLIVFFFTGQSLFQIEIPTIGPKT